MIIMEILKMGRFPLKKRKPLSITKTCSSFHSKYSSSILRKAIPILIVAMSQSGLVHAENWSISDLGTLGGATSSASAINNNGQIVGTSISADSGRSNATLWDHGSIKNLQSTYPYINGYATAINNKG